MAIYININQQQVGPVEIAQLNQMLAEQKIDSNTLAWQAGMTNWEPLSSPTFSSLGIKMPEQQGRTIPNESPHIQSTLEQSFNQSNKTSGGSGSFGVGSAIGEAFGFFKANAIGCIAWLVITSVASSTGIGFLLAPLLGVNFFACAKRFRDSGQKMELGELFDFSKAVEKIFGPIVLGFIIGVGFLFFIIPGVIFSIWWTFSPCILADRPNLSFTETMKQSRNAAKGNWTNLIMLFIALGLLQVLGFICLGIGLIVTIPVGHVALYFAYAQCKK